MEYFSGGGPAEEGANAARWDDTVQRAFYNGWKSVHGLKHQTVDCAFGLTVDMHGPTTLRSNDLSLLRTSNINQRLANVQMGSESQYIIMGDSAYKKQSHITSYHQREEIILGYREWNLKIKKVRISIEWNYGVTASLFKYVGMKWKLKLLKSDSVSKIYTVATLLRNLHVAVYGNETSNYFDVVLPSDFVEKYLSQTDF